MIYKNLFFLSIFFLFLFNNAFALNFDLPYGDDDLIGSVRIVQSLHKDTLHKISRRFEMGYYEMIKANPKVPRYSIIKEYTGITIPSFFILPKAPMNGIVINLPEMRLYYYTKDRMEVITEPIAIGRLGWKTPEVSTYVIEKIKDPIWVVPESIKLYSLNKGEILPEIMAPGPNNPLGQYALRLGVWSILIHGTNKPNSIGRRISSGCIRLYPEDIEFFYNEINKKTPVYVVNQPYKVGWYKNNLYLEVHPPLSETASNRYQEEAILYKLIMNKIAYHNIKIDWHRVAKILHEHKGIPYRINR